MYFKMLNNSKCKKNLLFFQKKIFYIFDQLGAEPPPQLVLAAPVAGAAFHSSA